MKKTIVLTVDYHTKRFAWNDQLGFSGGQPFGNNVSGNFDYVYDLLSLYGYEDIIYDIERSEDQSTGLTLNDLIPPEELKAIVDEIENEDVNELKVGDRIVYIKPTSSFNGIPCDVSDVVGVILQIFNKEQFIVKFDDISFLPENLESFNPWVVPKTAITKYSEIG